ncbi:MAG TPA: hypothetical protein VGK29_07080 [Paludibaculum sp.]|jgi:hypothetical protein
MALTRVTDRKIAANRANAQKSTGPRAPERKARSSRSACRHCDNARTHCVTESWDRGFRDHAIFITCGTANPARRAIELDFVFHHLWAERLAAQESNILANCLQRFLDDPQCAAHLFAFNPGSRALQHHLQRVERKATRIAYEIELHLKSPVRRQRRGQFAQPASGLARPNLFELIDFLNDLCRPKSHRQQNKHSSARPAAQNHGRNGLHHNPPI